LRCAAADFVVDLVSVHHFRGYQLASQIGRIGVALLLGEMALQHRIRRPLTEVRLKDGGKCQPPAGPSPADPIRPRRHQPAR
jgi:hypothetical protein